MTLARKLHPRSRASKNVRRIIRRLRHMGYHARTDTRGGKWPRTFLAVIGNAMERMAARRKVGGWKYLPAHVGKRDDERGYLVRLRGKK